MLYRLRKKLLHTIDSGANRHDQGAVKWVQRLVYTVRLGSPTTGVSPRVVRVIGIDNPTLEVSQYEDPTKMAVHRAGESARRHADVDASLWKFASGAGAD